MTLAIENKDEKGLRQI